MTAKTSEARREAFFRALAETGNQTIACERARVSRSWMTLHRAQDPAFCARMEACVAEARVRLRAETAAQDARWSAGEDGAPGALLGRGFFAGEELILESRRGGRTQIRRARFRQWTPRVETRFLSILTATCNVHAACDAVGLSVPSAYKHAARWPAFERRWREAIEIGWKQLEAALLDWACRALSGQAAGPTPILPLPPAQARDMIQQVWLHSARVLNWERKSGRPGVRREPDIDAVADRILAMLAVMDAAEPYRAAKGAAPRRPRYVRRTAS